MDAGAIVGLCCLVAVVAAVIIARRRGRQAWTAAVAEARAEGRAESDAAAAASAAAHGNRVDLHFGHGHHVRDEWSSASAGERGPFELDEDPYTDGLSPAVIRAELRRMDAMQRRRAVDARGMDELLERVQHGPPSGEHVRGPVAPRGLGNGNVPADGHPSQMSWGGE